MTLSWGANDSKQNNTTPLCKPHDHLPLRGLVITRTKYMEKSSAYCMPDILKYWWIATIMLMRHEQGYRKSVHFVQSSSKKGKGYVMIILRGYLCDE